MTAPTPATPAPGAPAVPEQPAPPPAPAPAQPAAPSGQPAEPSGKVEDLPDWAQRIITDVRKEAGDARTAAKTAADEAEKKLAQTIGKALGLVQDDAPGDPAKLTEQLTNVQSEARLLKVERALDKAARKHGADEDLLVAVLAHNGQLAKLDPTAGTFTAELDALVKAAVDANPKLKATQAAAASGAEFSGGSGEPSTDLSGKSVDDMRKLLKPKN